MFRARLPQIAALALVAAAIVSLPAPAHAAEAYSVEAYDCSNTGSGGIDAAGTFYVPCGDRIRRWDIQGNRLADLVTGRTLRHVKPSGDGRYIYYQANYELYRMYRRADGSYRNDTGFDPDPVVVAPSGCNPTGIYEPEGRGLATDHVGGVYVSLGGWINCSPNLIAKYDDDGNLLTVFGDYGDAPGQFRTNMGVAASRDGRLVYTVENSNSRVQRWKWHPDGGYRFDMLWGEVDDVHCQDGKFAAPYDVGLDPWGYVYVADTTCRRMQKFTADGQHLYSVQPNPGSVTRPHGIAVDAHGNAIMAEVLRRMVRQTPTPGPWPEVEPLPEPDTVAPTLAAVQVPAVTTDPTVDIEVEATDNIAVTELRIANEDGVWGPWREFAPVVAHELSDGYGVKAVFVQVRDAAGHESASRDATLRYEAPLDVTAPVLDDVEVPEISWDQQVDVAIQAHDDVAITEVRLANEDGVWGEWRAFAAVEDAPTILEHVLSDGHGPKGVYVQIRDAAWNHSEIAFRALTFTAAGNGDDGGDPGEGDPPVGDAADPVLVSAVVPPVTATREVQVQTEASDDTGVTGIRIANEDGNWGPWQPYAPAVAHTLSAGFGFKALFIQVRDGAGRESGSMLLRTQYAADAPPPADPGEEDLEAPVLADVTVPALVATQVVAVDVDATDDVGVVQVRTANEDGNWGPWREFADPLGQTLSAGFGLKGIYVQVRDAAGRESGVLFRTLMYAADAPPGGGPVGGAADEAAPTLDAAVVPLASPTAGIEIDIEASDDVGVAQARTANEDGEWGPWRGFADPLPHELSDGTGLKGVYVQVRDASGKESNVLFHTLLRVDAGEPVPAEPDAQAPQLNSVDVPVVSPVREIAVAIDAADNVAVTQMRFANEDGIWAPWRPWSAQTTHELSAGPGPKAVFVQVRDAVGNESAVILVRLSVAA